MFRNLGVVVHGILLLSLLLYLSVPSTPFGTFSGFPPLYPTQELGGRRCKPWWGLSLYLQFERGKRDRGPRPHWGWKLRVPRRPETLLGKEGETGFGGSLLLLNRKPHLSSTTVRRDPCLQAVALCMVLSTVTDQRCKSTHGTTP